eukprot:186972-Rhodomonas_salina.1
MTDIDRQTDRDTRDRQIHRQTSTRGHRHTKDRDADRQTRTQTQAHTCTHIDGARAGAGAGAGASDRQTDRLGQTDRQTDMRKDVQRHAHIQQTRIDRHHTRYRHTQLDTGRQAGRQADTRHTTPCHLCPHSKVELEKGHSATQLSEK